MIDTKGMSKYEGNETTRMKMNVNKFHCYLM
jgi:hypothetical protein